MFEFFNWMKFILLLIALTTSTGCLFSQTIFNNASWPNNSWTLSGTYDGTLLLNDPTTMSTKFSFDDQSGGIASVNNIILTSPIIDLTNAPANGERSIAVFGDVVFTSLTNTDALEIEVYDADADAWTVFYTIAADANAGANDYQTCANQTQFNSGLLDISTYTASQLAGFRYRISYNDNNTAQYGFCFSAPTLVSLDVCPKPSNISASNITTTSADLDWTETNTATTWDIEYVLSGDAPSGTPNEVGITAKPFGLTGLSPATSYDFYVRADCGAGTTSVFQGPYTFTTTCSPTSNLDAQNITETSADLSWTENGNASSWDIEVVENGNTPTGTPTQTSVSNPFTATGLLSNTDYTFYVRADCGGNPSSWTGPHSFTTLIPACAAPGSLNASNITHESAELTWVENGTAASWDIEIILSGGSQTMNPTASGLGTPSFNISGLVDNSSYEFFVRADCGGTLSSWTGPYEFTTLNAPVCDEPSDIVAANITSSSADINWTENGSATEWELEVVNTGVTPSGAPSHSNINQIPYTVTALSPDTDYAVYLRSVCDNGSESAWIGPYVFTTLEAPGCLEPSDLSASNITQESAELSWTENGTAVAYDIELLMGATSPTGTPNIPGISNPFNLPGLDAGTDYTYYVRASCSSTDKSDWVGPFAFTTLEGTVCETPTNLEASAIGDLEATLSWTETGSASSWEIELVQNGGTPTNTPTHTANNTPSLVVDGLSPGRTYSFFVRSFCDPDYSDWAGPFTFSSTATIEEQNNVQFQVYPNPNEGKFFIEISNSDFDGQIDMYSLQGKLVHSEKVKANKSMYQIDLKRNVSGVYLLTFVSASGISTQKITIK